MGEMWWIKIHWIWYIILLCIQLYILSNIVNYDKIWYESDLENIWLDPIWFENYTENRGRALGKTPRRGKQSYSPAVASHSSSGFLTLLCPSAFRLRDWCTEVGSTTVEVSGFEWPNCVRIASACTGLAIPFNTLIHLCIGNSCHGFIRRVSIGACPASTVLQMMQNYL